MRCAYFNKVKRWSRLKDKTVAREQSNHRVNCAAPQGTSLGICHPYSIYLFAEAIIISPVNEWNNNTYVVLYYFRPKRYYEDIEDCFNNVYTLYCFVLIICYKADNL